MDGFESEDILHNLSGTLLLGFVILLAGWLIQYHWRRRHLYKCAAQRNGPFSLPLIGSIWYFTGSSTYLAKKILNLHKHYDSPVTLWIGNRLYFLIWDPNDLETITNSPHALEKDELYKFLGVTNGLLTTDVVTWRRHRKIIAPTFNQKILNGFVEIFAEKNQKLLEDLKEMDGNGIFDALAFISKSTISTVCETAMGISTDTEDIDGNYGHWLRRGLDIAFIRMYTVWYHPDFIFNLTALKKEGESCDKKLREAALQVIHQKKAEYYQKVKQAEEYPEIETEDDNVVIKKTFLEKLIELSEEGDKLTEQELLEEVLTFMVAGSDTTALTSSYVLVMLGMFPEIQQKVYEETLDVLGPNKIVEYTDLGNFIYLERVIKETMRLFPLGAIILRSVSEDIQLEKCLIPKGCSVGILSLNLQRHPKYWPDPYKFDPDRFLPEEIAKRHPYSWIPFSGGPRNCIGTKYAMMALKSLISGIVRKFEITTDYKDVEDVKLKVEFITKPANGFRIGLKLRK